MDDSTIKLQARLDQTKSVKNINADVDKLQGKIDKLEVKAEIDPKTINNFKSLLQYLSEGAKKLSSWQNGIRTFTKVIDTAHQAVCEVKALNTALTDLNRTAQSSDCQQIQLPKNLSGEQDNSAIATDTGIAQSLFNGKESRSILDAVNSLGNGLDWLTGKMKAFGTLNALITTFVKNFA